MSTTAVNNASAGTVDKTSRGFNCLLGHNIVTQVAKQFTAPGMVLPWAFAAIGGPHSLAALILPINNTGSFVAQLSSGSILASFKLRKYVALLLSASIGLLLFLLSVTTMGSATAWTLALFLPLAFVMGLCSGTRSVALKDLMAKTLGTEGVRRLISIGGSVGGLITLLIAAATHFLSANAESSNSHLLQIWMGATLFVVSALFFLGVNETETPVNRDKRNQTGLKASFRALMQSSWYPKYLTLQILFLSVSLAVPFYSIHATTLHKNSASTLSVFIFAMAMGALLSKFFWDPLKARGVRFQFVVSAALTAVAAAYSLAIEFTPALQSPYFHGVAFLLVGLSSKGVLVAQTVYFNDKLSAEERTQYLGMNGALMALLGILGSFFIGVLATTTHIKYALLTLLVLNIASALYASLPSTLDEKSSVQN